MNNLNTKKNSICSFFGKIFAMDSIKSIIASLVCILGGFLVGAVILILLAAFTNDIPMYEAFSGISIILSGPFASGDLKDILFNLGDMLLDLRQHLYHLIHIKL